MDKLEVPFEAEAGSIAPYDPLRHYLAEIRRYPLLSREEERELAVQFREKGDRHALTRLILSHLRLVVSIAMEYRQIPIPAMDLIQEGNIGLMQAVKKFDPERNVRLSTYAAWWIRAYILRYMINNWRLVKIGTTEAQRKLFFNLNKEKERLERLGQAPEPKLLASNLGVREKDVIEMEQRLGGWEVSLDEPLSEEGEETIGTLLAHPQSPVDEEVAEKESAEQARRRVAAFEETLPPRDREVFRERILAEVPKTLDELGKKYRISKERVRQIEQKIMKKAKAFFKSVPSA